MAEERETRNAVFAPATSAAQATPPVDPAKASVADRLKSDFGLDIPVETVPLPSGGRVYPSGTTLNNRDTVDIKAMTAREEDILTSRALLKKGTVITELIKSCLVDKSIDPTTLLVGDRNALMVAIRITGYGPEYETEIECPECAVKSPYGFDLSQLPLVRLEIEPVVAGQNVFEFTLPYTKAPVRFKFLSGHDEEEIVTTQDKQKKLGLNSESTVTTNLLYSIVSVKGIEDRGKIAGFVRAMPARDSLALRSYIRDHEPGIRMKQDFTCKSCGHAEEVSMPIGVTFLWPSAK